MSATNELLALCAANISRLELMLKDLTESVTNIEVKVGELADNIEKKKSAPRSSGKSTGSNYSSVHRDGGCYYKLSRGPNLGSYCNDNVKNAEAIGEIESIGCSKCCGNASRKKALLSILGNEDSSSLFTNVNKKIQSVKNPGTSKEKTVMRPPPGSVKITYKDYEGSDLIKIADGTIATVNGQAFGSVVKGQIIPLTKPGTFTAKVKGLTINVQAAEMLSKGNLDEYLETLKKKEEEDNRSSELILDDLATKLSLPTKNSKPKPKTSEIDEDSLEIDDDSLEIECDESSELNE